MGTKHYVGKKVSIVGDSDYKEYTIISVIERLDKPTEYLLDGVDTAYCHEELTEYIYQKIRETTTNV